MAAFPMSTIISFDRHLLRHAADGAPPLPMPELCRCPAPPLRRYAAAACDDADGDYLSEGLQIVGMSATLPNVDKVAK